MFNSEDYKRGFKDGVQYAENNKKPETRIAHWIGEKHGKSHYTYICDHCYGKSKFRKSLFCPDCGYRMVEEEKQQI